MKSFLKNTLIFIVIIGVIIIAIGTGYAISILADKPTLDLELFQSDESTIVLDSEGNVISELGLYIRDNIEYDDMSTSLIDAFLAIEDSRYFDHPGFDIPRFAKAFLENIESMSFEQGGSTITMQLVKNTYFQIDADENSTIAESSIERKAQEIFLALELEMKLDKEEIFELYVNKLNFGANIRGVEKAAQYYFGKSVEDITISEAAMLAGIINAPNYYNPVYNLDYATERRDEVIDLMLYHGYISEIEAELAKAIKLEDLLVCDGELLNPTTSPYQAYIDAVVAEAYEKTGYDPVSTPMQIYTYLDPTLQDEVNKIQDGDYEHIQYHKELKQIAMITIDNQTGAILAMSGGRDYEGARMFNRAVDMYMQPGSSIKPVFSYALAFEELGWATSHIVTDEPITYYGSNIPIYNYNRKYYGDITIQYAHGNSLNTPVVKTAQTIVDEFGVPYVIDYLNSLGFSKVNEEQFDMGYALGGSGFVVSPEELAAAHGVLLNEGVYVEPHTIEKIVFQNGDVYYPNLREEEVLSAESAYLTSTLTKDAVSSKYYNYMQILQSPYEVYAKTGTSDWGTDGMVYGIPKGAPKDRWMVASTTQHTTVIWEGFDMAVEGGQTWLTTSEGEYNIRGKALRIVLDTLYADEEDYPADMQMPEGVEEITHINGTFPYATGSVGSYTTGLIKDEFNETINIYDSPYQASNFTSLSAHRNDDGSIGVAFGSFAYLDSNGSWKRNLSLPEHNIYATGAVIFDYSWVFGSPRFYVDIYSGDYHVTSLSGSNAYLSGYVGYEYGGLKACGYVVYGTGSVSQTRCDYF